MLKLIREHEVGREFRRLKRGNPVHVAVPFWGEKGPKSLGLTTKGPAKIICNLASGACDPFAVELLQKRLGRKNVKTHPRLHAKIYASQTTCIVGSSNASASGLALVLDSPRNWIEANILTDEPAIVEEANALFDDLWHSIECEEITSAALKAAKLRWNHRPSRPSTHVSPSLLDACRANPTKFANVFIAAYDEDLGPSGKEIMKVVRTNQEARAKKLAGRVQRAYGFQFERIDDDCWLIDLDCRKSIAKIWGGGIYRIPDKPSRFCDLADETDLTLGFRASLELPGVVGRLVLTASDKRILIKNASKLLRAGGNRPLPLARAIKITDGPKKSR